MVLEDPAPFLQPVMTTTLSPVLATQYPLSTKLKSLRMNPGSSIVDPDPVGSDIIFRIRKKIISEPDPTRCTKME